MSENMTVRGRDRHWNVRCSVWAAVSLGGLALCLNASIIDERRGMVLALPAAVLGLAVNFYGTVRVWRERRLLGWHG